MFGILYRNVLKPFLFLFPADNVHEFFIWLGGLLEGTGIDRLLGKIWNFEDASLTQNIEGLIFKNPVGLAAGFDYNADLAGIIPKLGFGFHTVGTLTNEPYGGNPPPMLGRLPRSGALIVNKGFKNESIKKVLSGLKKRDSSVPLGVSIGATNKPYVTFENMVGDIIAGFREAEKWKNFDYYELNISCPNLDNIKNLPDSISSPTGLKKILEGLSEITPNRPVFIKMPLERSSDEMRSLIEVAVPFPFIKGLVFSNLAKNRNNPVFHPEEIKNAGRGNFSGKPTRAISDEMISFAYKNYGKRFVLVGVGGIFTAEDAYRKIRLGASLVQLITGMIYMGPQQISTINRELVKLIERDGFYNLAEAVGSLSK